MLQFTVPSGIRIIEIRVLGMRYSRIEVPVKTWNITRTQFKVSDFLTWYKNQELDLSPFFQRRAVWKPGAKSYLMDTVIRGLPIPAIILREVPSDLRTFTARREVVDGQQRIRTVITFVSAELLQNPQPTDYFALTKSHNAEYAGRPFPELPKEVRQRILDYQFMVHIFPSETDDREILEGALSARFPMQMDRVALGRRALALSWPSLFGICERRRRGVQLALGKGRLGRPESARGSPDAIQETIAMTVTSNEEFAKRMVLLARPAGHYRPTATYDRDGDCIEFLAKPDPFYAERIDDLVTVYYSQETGEIVGCLVKGV